MMMITNCIVTEIKVSLARVNKELQSHTSHTEFSPCYEKLIMCIQSTLVLGVNQSVLKKSVKIDLCLLQSIFRKHQNGLV